MPPLARLGSDAREQSVEKRGRGSDASEGGHCIDRKRIFSLSVSLNI